MAVAFHLDGPERPQWLSGDAYVPLGKNIGSCLYLFGLVLARGKVTKTDCAYRIEWEHTNLRESIIDINVLHPAMELARKLKQVLEVESKHPLGVDVLNFLRTNDGSTPGVAIESDVEGNEEAEDDDDENRRKTDNVEVDTDDDNSINFAFPSLENTVGGNTTREDGLIWATNIGCPPNLALYDEKKPSTIKTETKIYFGNHLSSFLAFLPLEFWKLLVFETNRLCRK